jgi:hypothetical protein
VIQEASKSFASFGTTMRCSKCGTDNAADARFCNQCATPLSRRCPNCARLNAPDAKFCAECAEARTSDVSKSTARTPSTSSVRVALEQTDHVKGHCGLTGTKYLRRLSRQSQRAGVAVGMRSPTSQQLANLLAHRHVRRHRRVLARTRTARPLRTAYVCSDAR